MHATVHVCISGGGGIHNIGGGGGGAYTDCIHPVQRGRWENAGWEEAPPSRMCITSERTRWAMVCPLGGQLAFNWHLTINCRLGYSLDSYPLANF